LIDEGRKVAWPVFVAGVVLIAASACGPAPVTHGGPQACGTLDSLFTSCGFGRPLTITGHATVDANDYKVRGKVRVETRRPGEAVIEFTSTVLFGHAREDLVFSSVGDTVRIVDRERGAYSEGAEAEEFLAESLDTDLDVRLVLQLALGGRPPCDDLSDVGFRTTSAGSIVCTGMHSGRDFRVVFGADRRIQEAEWPVRSRTYGTDRLRASYEWDGDGGDRGELKGLVLSLEKREWRCKIRSAG
jgi:hypothetical protein